MWIFGEGGYGTHFDNVPLLVMDKNGYNLRLLGMDSVRLVIVNVRLFFVIRLKMLLFIAANIYFGKVEGRLH